MNASGYRCVVTCLLVSLVAPAVFSQRVLFQCDFEVSLCAMTNERTDSSGPGGSFDWTRYQGQTPSGISAGGTGPSGGQGQSRYYIYIEASDPQRQGDSARIVTPLLRDIGPACLQFYYHMYGRDVGSLQVYSQVNPEGPRKVIWQQGGDQDDVWRLQRNDIDIADSRTQIGFAGIRGTNFRGDIALDTVSVFTGACNSASTPTPSQPPGSVNLPFQCNFDSSNICNLIQRIDDQFDWLRQSGPTATSFTGPTAAQSGTHYLYIESSDPRVLGDRAMIETPIINYSGEACVMFYYHMFGSAIGELQVYTSGQGRNNPWQRLVGQQGNLWRQLQVDVTLRANDQVGLTGIRGNEIQGDIAVDDFLVRPGRCVVSPPPTPTPTSAPTPAPPATRNLPFSCGFESNVCDFVQRVDDRFDWSRTDQGTPTQDTGPARAFSGRYYVYAETSAPRRDGDNAIIETPALNYEGTACVSFYYHMWGADQGRLLVYTLFEGRLRPLLDESGDHGNRWIQARVSRSLRRTDKIMFEAIRGRDIRGDIGLDELRIDPGSCVGVPPTPRPPFPTPSPPVGGGDIYSCDVETVLPTSSRCRLRQARDDTFDWIRQSGRTPTGASFDRRINNVRYPVTGPDGARQGSFYLYIEASGRAANEVARVYIEGSDVSNTFGSSCVRFFYSMNGFHTGVLRLTSRSGSEPRKERWSVSGDQLNGWQRAAVDVDMTNVAEVALAASTNGQFSGDIAVDDVQVARGQCQSTPSEFLFMCSFETPDGSSTLCGMEQDLSDTFGFDWTLKKGATPSQLTGPDRAFNGRYYIYIEASRPRVRGDFARILLPNMNGNGPICVEFMYHMYGFHIGTLELFARSGGRDNVQWSLVGEQSNAWRAHRYTINNFRFGDRVGFRAIRGGEFSGDIAIDDIRVRPRAC